MIRSGIRPVMLSSQLMIADLLPNVDILPGPDGELDITGLPEPTSIYSAEVYPDPGKPRTPTPSHDLLAAPYRSDSAVPDTLQYRVFADDSGSIWFARSISSHHGIITRTMG